MRQLVLVLMLAGSLSASLAQKTAHTARPLSAPPACRAVTTEMLSRPLVLQEGCYRINQFTNVGQPLNVSPGSTIIFGEGATLSVESNASLEAIGTVEKPIVFRGKEGTAGFWRGISISSNSSHNRLSYVTIQDAGVSGSDSAAILIAPGAQLGIDHSTVTRALGTGILVMDDARFSHFEANHFTNTGVPLRIKASDVASIDPATTFSGNKNNVVAIPFGEGKVDQDVLWRKLAVPYQFEASVDVGAHLTIEAGAQLQFRANLSLNINGNGSLKAIGTATEPILFTATDETPGYWSGIFYESSSASNILKHVEVRYGGSKGGAVGGGVGITHQASATVQSSTLSFCPVGIFVASEGRLNGDASTSNQFHDNERNIVIEH